MSQKERNIYETKRSVNEYILMHYGTQKELCNYPFAPVSALNFPFRCAKQCQDLAELPGGWGTKGRVLDLGCAVGGASFHLAKYFESVVGIDYSQAFVDTANDIKKSGKMHYSYTTEGELMDEADFEIPSDIDRTRCKFLQGDACNLDIKSLGQFEIVLGANLVCRLPEPAQFLASCGQLIVKGGYLVLPSPYTWLPQFTDKTKWIGGYMKDGKPVRSFDGLKAHLGKNFEFVRDENMPFFIKETARKHQWSVSHCTIWKRR
jgi:putative 4-mercaptohistidine N1-methyltranferase